MSSLVLAAAPQTSVSNTTTETELFIYPIPTMNFGQAMRITLRGRIDTAAGGATLRLRAKIGAELVSDTGAVSLSGSLSSFGWSLELLVVLAASGVIEVSNAGFGSSTFRITSEQEQNLIVLDDGEAQLRVTAEWGAADPADIVSLRQVVVEHLKL